MAVASLPFGCATAFIAVLLGEKRKLEKPSGFATTATAAASQKRRRFMPGALFTTTSSITGCCLQVLRRSRIPRGITTRVEVCFYDALVSLRSSNSRRFFSRVAKRGSSALRWDESSGVTKRTNANDASEKKVAVHFCAFVLRQTARRH